MEGSVGYATLADKSFSLLSSDRLTNLAALAKIARAADTPDNIRGWTFGEKKGFLECDGFAAHKTAAATDGPA